MKSIKCKRYKEWLHLNREGELTPRQWSKLERHLSQCSSCAEEKRNIVSTDQIIHAVRGHEPVHSNPTELTHHIMVAIDHSDGHITGAALEKQTSHWLDWLYRPKVRLAMAGIVLLLLGTFIFQGTLILHRLQRLEQKMGRQTETPFSLDTFLSRKTAHAVADRIMENKDLLYQQLTGDEEWVIIDKHSLLKLLRRVIKSRGGDERLIRELLREPRLSRELRKIMEKRRRI